MKKLLSIILSIMILLSTVISAVAQESGIPLENWEIQILYDNQKMELDNKPFFYEYSAYIPLRELAKKLGISENENNQILWDNGKIYIYLEGREDFYEINIGENRIYYDAKEPAVNARGFLEYRNAPVLMNNTTYIPWEYVYPIFCSFGYYYDIHYKIGNLDSRDVYGINVEGLTYSQVHELQYKVDNGHYLWRLDPKQVIMEHVTENNDLGGVIKNMVFDGAKCTADYTSKYDITYSFELFQPVKTGEDGIWVVKSGILKAGFNDAEINSAKAVVEKYFEAKKNKDRNEIITTLTSWHDTPNRIFWQDETIELNEIAYDITLDAREQYITNGNGRVNGTALENVIVFNVKFTVSNAEKSAYTNGEYTDYKMILIRENANSEWLIDDMGY